MTAFQSMMLSGHGLPDMPPGGSLERRLKSRIRRLLQLVDLASESIQCFKCTKCHITDHWKGRVGTRRDGQMRVMGKVVFTDAC
jgi:hypothetical protein